MEFLESFIECCCRRSVDMNPNPWVERLIPLFCFVFFCFLPFLTLSLAICLTSKSPTIIVLAFVLYTIFLDSLYWKSLIWRAFFLLIRVTAFATLRYFLLFFCPRLPPMQWSLLDLASSIFEFQYLSGLGVLTSKNLPWVFTAVTIFVIPKSIAWYNP